MPKISHANLNICLTKSETYFVTDFVTVCVADFDRYYEKLFGCNYDIVSDRFCERFCENNFVTDFVMYFVRDFMLYFVQYSYYQFPSKLVGLSPCH